MLEAVNFFLQILTITTGIFLMTRYVFLEPGMEAKKQRIFYIVGYALMFVSYMTLGGGIPQVISTLLGGLNIAFGRKKHKVAGFLLVFPLMGIIDGACGPIIFIEQFLVPENAKLANYIVFSLFVMLGGFLLLFYLKGKEWRRWFAENMKNRRPLPSEYVILCSAGFLALVVNNVTGMIAASKLLASDARETILLLVTLCEMILFLLTITIVILIMQGNRRKFYHDSVSNMQFNMIATMADIVENRDSNTGGHIKRTAKYVEIIGKNLRRQKAFAEILTDQYLGNMIVAAPLHDIGKISIPDAILNKPSRLTEEEFAIMKTHTTAGRDALLNAKKQLGEFDYLNVAQDMAEYHHEWWNGKGYPNGISGEEIPLCARIMAVADVFDALTSRRCYKEAMPLNKAYNIIKSEAGTHFDPLVSEVFLDSCREIEEAMESEGAEE